MAPTLLPPSQASTASYCSSSNQIQETHNHFLLISSSTMEPHKSAISTRSLKRRKPLADLTNAPSLSSDLDPIPLRCLPTTSSDSVRDGSDRREFEISADHRREGVDGKISALAAAIRNKSKMLQENFAKPRPCSVLHHKATKKQRYKVKENKRNQDHLVPQDFIDKQKAYFAEVDAFELVEEEISESELD